MLTIMFSYLVTGIIIGKITQVLMEIDPDITQSLNVGTFILVALFWPICLFVYLCMLIFSLGEKK